MASFSDNFKQNLKQNIRDEFESRTGIIGQALRDKRRREEQQAKEQEQVQAIQESTSKITHVGTTLSRLETSFIQISKNIQLIAKSFDAQVTLQEETNKVLQERAKLKREQKDPVSVEPQKQQQVQKQIETPPEDKTLFEKILDTIEDIDKFRKGGGKGGKAPTKTPPKTPSKGGGKLGKLKTFGKIGGKILGKAAGPASLALGAYEASEFLKETGYGERMAKGEGARAQKAFKEKNTDFSNQPLTAQQAQDILDSKSERDIKAFGGKERLEKIAGVQPVAKPVLPATGAGGGRGFVNPPAVIPEPPAIPPSIPPNVVRTEHGIVTSGTGEAVTSGAPVSIPPPVAVTKPPAAAAPPSEAKAQGNGKFSNQKDFINALSPYAEKASQMIGGKVPPVAILGQWAGESGSGSSMPAAFNYAGIKAGSQFEKGDFVLTEERYTDAQLERAKKSGEELAAVLGPDDKMSKKGRQVTVDEWYGKGAWQAAKNEGKNWVQVKSYFAKFKSFDDFATSFAKFISAPRYAKAREQTTPAGFGFEIAKAGYATASAEKYSAKIANFAASQSGSELGNMSASVAAAKNDISKKGGSVTVAVIQQAPETKKAAPQQPRSQVMTSVG